MVILMKTVSEKLAARLHKEFPELGIKPHTKLVRKRPDPYWPDGVPQSKWDKDLSADTTWVWSYSSMQDCLNGDIEIVANDLGFEVRVKT